MVERIVLKNPVYDFNVGILREYEDDYYRSPEFQKFQNNCSQLLTACKELYPKAGRYLGCRLHDSRVISFDYTKNKVLEMTFNDYYYIDFSMALMYAEKINVPDKKLVFPVTLKFSSIKKCLVYWCNRNNKLLPLKTEKYLPKIAEYLYDEIQEVGKDYLNIGFNFWTTMLKSSKCNLFMQIIAEKFSVVEHQRKVLFEIFDGKYHSLFEKFTDELEKCRDFDITVAKSFIEANKHLISE